MSRRRRIAKESPYSADSFLDIICNLVYKYVGIVLIVLVLVAKQASLWPNLNTLRLGQLPPQETEVAEAPLPALPSLPEIPIPAAPKRQPRPKMEEPPDPVAEGYEKAIAQLRGRLLEQLRTLEVAKSEAGKLRNQQGSLVEQETTLERKVAALAAQVAAADATIQRTETSARPLKERIDELQKALKELEAVPPERRALKFHPPISRPVNAGELFFECRQGRITFVDLQELLDRVKSGMSARGEELKTRWELVDEVGPVGPFVLKYKLARHRSGGLDNVFGDIGPSKDRSFGYGVAEWEVRPVKPERGETVEQALGAVSAFRRIADSLDTDQAVLTFFVYEDSFAAFRTLRDYLSERGFLVAGRPLPMDAAISGSPKGTKSRAQ
jgi:chaperonin cofactor prefoldin